MTMTRLILDSLRAAVPCGAVGLMIPVSLGAARRTLGGIILASMLVLPALSSAQTWPPPFPEGGDSRVFVDGNTIREDRVTVWVPYNYGTQSDHEWRYVEKVADWACGLYNRRAGIVSHNSSDAACDEMGSAAAERSGQCWHLNHFACASR